MVKSTCANHTKHITKITAGRHLYVFDDISKSSSAIDNTATQDHQVFFQQDNIGTFFSDIGTVSTEIPTSASLMAAASLMPSPIKPTVCPFDFNTFTIRCFCNGLTFAKLNKDPYSCLVPHPRYDPVLLPALYC